MQSFVVLFAEISLAREEKQAIRELKITKQTNSVQTQRWQCLELILRSSQTLSIQKYFIKSGFFSHKCFKSYTPLKVENIQVENIINDITLNLIPNYYCRSLISHYDF